MFFKSNCKHSHSQIQRKDESLGFCTFPPFILCSIWYYVQPQYVDGLLYRPFCIPHLSVSLSLPFLSSCPFPLSLPLCLCPFPLSLPLCLCSLPVSLSPCLSACVPPPPLSPCLSACAASHFPCLSACVPLPLFLPLCLCPFPLSVFVIMSPPSLPASVPMTHPSLPMTLPSLPASLPVPPPSLPASLPVPPPSLTTSQLHITYNISMLSYHYQFPSSTAIKPQLYRDLLKAAMKHEGSLPKLLDSISFFA